MESRLVERKRNERSPIFLAIRGFAVQNLFFLPWKSYALFVLMLLSCDRTAVCYHTTALSVFRWKYSLAIHLSLMLRFLELDLSRWSCEQQPRNRAKIRQNNRRNNQLSSLSRVLRSSLSSTPPKTQTRRHDGRLSDRVHTIPCGTETGIEFVGNQLYQPCRPLGSSKPYSPFDASENVW